MCGIAGFIDWSSVSNLDILKNMTNELSHRGPDDCGFFHDITPNFQIGLGHRRLSILDLSENGHQPMSFGDLTVVYNGEIYNFKEIKEELIDLGYDFSSQTDTEVVLKAYDRWGYNAIEKFNGMFAIVIYNRKDNKLSLIRDRAGVKPLFWFKSNNVFLFASELKGLLRHPKFVKELDNNGLYFYLQHGYISQPNTIFKNTHKLLSGHYLELDIDNGAHSIHKYWDIFDYYNKEKLKIQEEDAIVHVESLLKSACGYRMISDVPVGIFLSGGYDSSVVTAILQSQHTEKIKTFTLGFSTEKFNEAEHAKKIAEYLGTDHTEYYCNAHDALNALSKISEIWDEPLADNSTIPTLLISEVAKQNVNVAISADGGDEVFAGYNKYETINKYHNKFRLVPARKIIGKTLSRFSCHSSRIESAIRILSSDNEVEALKKLQNNFTENELLGLVNFNAIEIDTAFNDFQLLESSLNPIEKMMAIDYKTYQSDYILAKVDRACMSVGLEGREPLLDFRLAEYIAQLPAGIKIRGDEKKYLLKKISQKYLPKELIDRPKMGFNIPINYWLGNEFKEFTCKFLNEKSLKNHGLFKIKAVNQLLSDFFGGNILLAGKVWTLLVFQMWYEKWMN